MLACIVIAFFQMTATGQDGEPDTSMSMPDRAIDMANRESNAPDIHHAWDRPDIPDGGSDARSGDQQVPVEPGLEPVYPVVEGVLPKVNDLARAANDLVEAVNMGIAIGSELEESVEHITQEIEKIVRELEKPDGVPRATCGSCATEFGPENIDD